MPETRKPEAVPAKEGFRRFQEFARQVLSVPKSEVEARRPPVRKRQRRRKAT